MFTGLARLSILAAGAVYTIGVLIVNLNLGQYGLVSLDLARPEYVMAGLLWLFLVLSTALAIHSSVAFGKRMRKEKPRLWILRLSVIGFFGCTLPAFTILPAVGYNPGTDAPWWVNFVGTGLIVASGGALYLGLGAAKEQLGKEPLTSIVSAAASLNRVINFVPLQLLALGLYAAVVFPDIPREYGGGRRATVELVLSEVPSVDWSAAGLEFSGATKRIGPAMLLLDTDHSLVVVRPETWKERRFFRVATSARVLALDRKLVAAVVYLPRQLPGGTK
jgi:hypothetical protein